MSELTDTIQESVENAGKGAINSKVAIFVSITATFMALCNVKDGNIVQAMSQAQAHSIDAWSYFPLLSISPAMFGITALTQKRWLFYFAAGVSLLGIILGLTAFIKISLHSDFVSKILS